MITRILPRAEYARLASTELGVAIPYLTADARVLVVEHEDTIVGCWAYLHYPHVEGLWIHPDHRKRGGVGRQLLTFMSAMAGSAGELVVLTAAMSPEVEQLILKAGGQRLPGSHFVLPIGGR